MTRKNAIRLIGLERCQVGEEMKRKYEAGASIRALADEAGRSYGGVYRLLQDAGAAFRRPGVAKRKGFP
ncbi:helix-turn-helix domain-containing protein [Streptomyces sp. PA03-6a]|nr:helix-turn-helix domain-containing protein [Streptomyces sp. PA03-6a]